LCLSKKSHSRPCFCQGIWHFVSNSQREILLQVCALQIYVCHPLFSLLLHKRSTPVKKCSLLTKYLKNILYSTRNFLHSYLYFQYFLWKCLFLTFAQSFLVHDLYLWTHAKRFFLIAGVSFGFSKGRLLENKFLQHSACRRVVFLMPLKSWRFVRDTSLPNSIFFFILQHHEVKLNTKLKFHMVSLQYFFNITSISLFQTGLKSHPPPIFTDN
jgi:hypothetical protein